MPTEPPAQQPASPEAPAPALPADARCVAHPSRPAVDRCPECGRPRCGADAQGPGCPVCRAGEQAGPRRTGSGLEVVVRAAVGASAVAFPGGWVLSEYVGSSWFQYLAPVVVGVACAWVATSASGDPRGRVRTWVRALAAGYAVLAVALGFVVEGTYSVVATRFVVLVPYAAAAAAAWLWSAPPRARRR